MTSPYERRSLKARPTDPNYTSPRLSPTGPPPVHGRPSMDSLNWDKLMQPVEENKKKTPNIPTVDEEPICVLKLDLNGP